MPALELGGYECVSNANIGQRPSGKRHLVDVLATDSEGRKILISLKWQQVAGTAEEKIPYEVMCLAYALKTEKPEFSDAYLVLGGEGWSLREFYLRGGLNEHIRDGNLVKIRTLESFIAVANQGRL